MHRTPSAAMQAGANSREEPQPKFFPATKISPGRAAAASSGRRASYVGRLLGAFQQEHLRQELDYDLVVNTFREGHLCEEKGLHFHSPYSCAILGGLSPADMDALAQLETDLPLVLYNRRQAGFGAVYTDYAKAVRQVMELARAKGCRSIGFLKNRSNFMADSSRIRDAITAAGEYRPTRWWKRRIPTKAVRWASKP